MMPPSVPRVPSRSGAPSSPFSQGFTLIELLVIVGMLGILVTALMVGMSSYRKKAFDVQATACGQGIATAQGAVQTSEGGYRTLTSAEVSAIRACKLVMQSAGQATPGGLGESASASAARAGLPPGLAVLGGGSLHLVQAQTGPESLPGVHGAAGGGTFAYFVRHAKGGKAIVVTNAYLGDWAKRPAGVSAEVAAVRGDLTAGTGGTGTGGTGTGTGGGTGTGTGGGADPGTGGAPDPTPAPDPADLKTGTYEERLEKFQKLCADSGGFLDDMETCMYEQTGQVTAWMNMMDPTYPTTHVGDACVLMGGTAGSGACTFTNGVTTKHVYVPMSWLAESCYDYGAARYGTTMNCVFPASYALDAHIANWEGAPEQVAAAFRDQCKTSGGTALSSGFECRKGETSWVTAEGNVLAGVPQSACFMMSGNPSGGSCEFDRAYTGNFRYVPALASDAGRCAAASGVFVDNAKLRGCVWNEGNQSVF